MNKRKLYESIMHAVSIEIKNALNEYNVMGAEVDSLILPKMSDIDDLDKPVNFNYKDITNQVQSIFNNMIKNYRFSLFLKDNNITNEIQWSNKVSTACTDGYNGQIIMNPEFMRTVYNNAGEQGVLFIILHESMHNYYNNVKHVLQIKTVADNVIIDRRINAEIIFKWPEFKGVPEQIGALL